MQTRKNKYKGYCLTEVLIVFALSSVVLFGIFSNYLFVKHLYMTQKIYALEQENIRMAYQLLLNFFENTQSVSVIAQSDLSGELGSRSDALAFRSNEIQTIIYIRSTRRKNITSLYLKEEGEYAKELIPGISSMKIVQEEANVFRILLSFDHADELMHFSM